jgi:DNA-binding NarL/FixJ family response regulator
MSELNLKPQCLKLQTGAQLVEFAIILPLLITILFAVIEFGFMLYDQAIITNASREGARGYVSKNESNESILKSIKEALKGNFPISPMLARYLFKLAQSTNSNGEKNIKNNLTAKEMEILNLIADGKEYLEIAKKLKVAISTIQTHIRKLYKKLNAHSKTQAILKARESGILN